MFNFSSALVLIEQLKYLDFYVYKKQNDACLSVFMLFCLYACVCAKVCQSLSVNVDVLLALYAFCWFSGGMFVCVCLCRF